MKTESLASWLGRSGLLPLWQRRRVDGRPLVIQRRLGGALACRQEGFVMKFVDDLAQISPRQRQPWRTRQPAIRRLSKLARQLGQVGRTDELLVERHGQPDKQGQAE